jgi:hypothetical protein
MEASRRRRARRKNDDERALHVADFGFAVRIFDEIIDEYYQAT